MSVCRLTTSWSTTLRAGGSRRRRTPGPTKWGVRSNATHTDRDAVRRRVGAQEIVEQFDCALGATTVAVGLITEELIDAQIDQGVVPYDKRSSRPTDDGWQASLKPLVIVRSRCRFHQPIANVPHRGARRYHVLASRTTFARAPRLER